ncbi:MULTISPECIES: hypothetical protein [Dyella]|uniref:Uncharacterized protein n=2 Tax=Dyella TaxID=231454 RepID=A0A4R0YRM1_9GAMM|nr:MULTISPECIES: hypothetical protein [Dyella]TBR40586.1 hypothetical protein EYV96_10655 [Dyella terrae]TCI11832.1 hypothetical protein EZM97_00215 [Dyella soli]
MNHPIEPLQAVTSMLSQALGMIAGLIGQDTGHGRRPWPASFSEWGEDVRRVLARRLASGSALIHTSDIIKDLTGAFVSERDTPARRSRNAAFGRWLSDHRVALGLSLDKPRVRVTDATGHATRAARWFIHPM